MVFKQRFLFFFYFMTFLLFAVFSYAFLDPNLTFTSIKSYLFFQKELRAFGLANKHLLTTFFLLFVLLIFILYLLLFLNLRKRKADLRKILTWWFLIFIVLIFAYPAFSHDIFNYIFNAKMVLVYKADPHQQVALSFKDPMLDFMRNTHTPAPYFYGWTIISLLPSLVSFSQIFISFINFKIFSGLLFFLSFIFLDKILSLLAVKGKNLRLFLFLFNPLILVEVLGVGHNDFSMMAPALASFYYLTKYKKEKKLSSIILFILLLAFSISTKYASIVLLPLFLIWYFKSDFDLGFWGSILLFLIPFSRPLDQLHSWYLIWPLTWIFLSKNIKAVYFFCFLSFFSLLRYFPYIWYGHWDPPVAWLRFFIYFFIPVLSLFAWLLYSFWVKLRYDRKNLP